MNVRQVELDSPADVCLAWLNISYTLQELTPL